MDVGRHLESWSGLKLGRHGCRETDSGPPKRAVSSASRENTSGGRGELTQPKLRRICLPSVSSPRRQFGSRNSAQETVPRRPKM
ncbi:hypothetical protein E2C01_101998 [Portunus trituberculatus]|uniref:Uncharacterized protein n=1 Tax=Portunus trituberculatus TaxID=210409 RepID=A0A5B7KH82_PORTR|nr:hypothetical protein [Portunus trituberculatus]